jgi:hypothetical protein
MYFFYFIIYLYFKSYNFSFIIVYTRTYRQNQLSLSITSVKLLDKNVSENSVLILVNSALKNFFRALSVSSVRSMTFVTIYSLNLSLHSWELPS